MTVERMGRYPAHPLFLYDDYSLTAPPRSTLIRLSRISVAFQTARRGGWEMTLARRHICDARLSI